ncbi:MAG TPA: hypothetical protein VFR66_09670 [Burkholderiales bacterium]|nr:hypothetical protein [Burkholderiales bacterium]
MGANAEIMDVEQPPKPALPLLALLALASALGIAVAVALAAVAMMLAAPAYADDGFTRGIGAPKPALLTPRPGASVVERTALIGAGETLRVEVECPARGPRRRVLARCC